MIRRRRRYNTRATTAAECRLPNPFSGGGDIAAARGGSGAGRTGNENRPARTRGI